MVFKGKTTPGTEFYISTARSDIPKNAILVGQVGGKDSYVGCYTVGEDFTPAHIIAGDRKAYYTGGAHSHYTYAHTYLTLTAKYTTTWSAWQDGKVPDNAVKLGGNATEDFFVGRIAVDGDTWVGKVVPSKSGLVYPMYEEEKFSASYEVLTVAYDFTQGTSYYVSQKISDVPENAIIAGTTKDGSPVYVGAAYFTSFVPGRAVPAAKQIFFPDSEGENSTEQMIYLTYNEGFSYKWVSASEGSVPDHAAAIGSKVSEPNYVGRFKHELEDCVGVVNPSASVISYPFGGKTHTSSTYDVLVVSRSVAISDDLELYYSTGYQDIPESAIQVGTNSYVGYIKHKEESTPGMINIREELGFGWLHCGYNKKDFISTQLIFLVFKEGTTLAWGRAADGDVPEHAIKLGQDANGEDYYVGRATMDSQACVGKISKAAGGCLVPKNGGEKLAKSYDALVVVKN